MGMVSVVLKFGGGGGKSWVMGQWPVEGWLCQKAVGMVVNVCGGAGIAVVSAGLGAGGSVGRCWLDGWWWW